MISITHNTNDKYQGWDAYAMDNQLIKIHVIPSLGGRIIQLEMDGNNYLFVNNLLKGKEPGPTGLSETGSWLNFGGEKIWPAPQGWDLSNQWPGPPDPILDSGIYSVIDENNHTGENKLKLISPYDNYTGLQIAKEIVLSETRSEVSICATFYNKSTVLKSWSIWPVIQVNTPDLNMEDRYQIVCPINSKSDFEKGYKVMHGIANNPQNGLDSYGNMVINYKYIVAKVGLDANSNWLAFMDKVTGKVFLLLFTHEEDQFYPENTSIQVWTQGRGIIYSRNKIVEYANDLVINPPYIEMELLSPLKEIPPGESMRFEYRMLTCTIAKYTEIKSVNNIAVIATSLRLQTGIEGLLVIGQYGVFSNGTIRLQFKDKKNNLIQSPGFKFEKSVSPFEEVILEVNISRVMWLIDQDLTAMLTLDLFDQDNKYIGELDQVRLDQRPS
ncbi:MAG TPA: DUF4380 domain-containing protein [Arachidicoccus sp.]|nr:DUF4380 domain-containing protein [Arachidicoccus sp.]